MFIQSTDKNRNRSDSELSFEDALRELSSICREHDELMARQPHSCASVQCASEMNIISNSLHLCIDSHRDTQLGLCLECVRADDLILGEICEHDGQYWMGESAAPGREGS